MGRILEGKVAVVTGAGHGIGRAYALLMAEEGASVVVNNPRRTHKETGATISSADEVVTEISRAGGTAIANYDTVDDSSGADNIIKAAVDKFGKIDTLVNNAGFSRDRMIWNMSDEEWDQVIKVHVYGHFYCTRSACKVMRQQKSGRIINTASLAAFGNPGNINYVTSKAAIVGFTKGVALEMGRYGVTCNAIMPTAVTKLSWTPQIQSIWEKRAAEGSQQAKEILEEMPYWMPEDNAPLVVYLASDLAANLNGCVFYVKGNMIELWKESEPDKTIFTVQKWTAEQLIEMMPKTLARGLINPAPSRP